LAVQAVAGSNVLFATKRLDGVVSSWNIGGGGLTQIEADAYKSQALVSVIPELGFVGDARHRQVTGPSGSESRGARSQAAFNSRVMSSQIQWASALVWR
jgi:hypothetical protein